MTAKKKKARPWREIVQSAGKKASSKAKRAGSTELSWRDMHALINLAKEIANLERVYKSMPELDLDGVAPKTAFWLGALTGAAGNVLAAWSKPP